MNKLTKIFTVSLVVLGSFMNNNGVTKRFFENAESLNDANIGLEKSFILNPSSKSNINNISNASDIVPTKKSSKIKHVASNNKSSKLQQKNTLIFHTEQQYKDAMPGYDQSFIVLPSYNKVNNDNNIMQEDKNSKTNKVKQKNTNKLNTISNTKVQQNTSNNKQEGGDEVEMLNIDKEREINDNRSCSNVNKDTQTNSNIKSIQEILKSASDIISNIKKNNANNTVSKKSSSTSFLDDFEVININYTQTENDFEVIDIDEYNDPEEFNKKFYNIVNKIANGYTYVLEKIYNMMKDSSNLIKKCNTKKPVDVNYQAQFNRLQEYTIDFLNRLLYLCSQIDNDNTATQEAIKEITNSNIKNEDKISELNSLALVTKEKQFSKYQLMIRDLLFKSENDSKLNPFGIDGIFQYDYFDKLNSIIRNAHKTTFVTNEPLKNLAKSTSDLIDYIFRSYDNIDSNISRINF